MIKLFTKKRKGFTLIELIVVIAILGILMVIAIPRFSGFTEKARISNDEQYAALIANATNVMVATGDVKYTDATKDLEISIDKDGKVTAISNLTFDKLTDLAGYNTELVKLVATKALQSTEYASGMKATTNDSGIKSISK